MNEDKNISLFQLLKLSFKSYLPVFRVIWLEAILLAFLKNTIFYFNGLVINEMFKIFMIIILSVLVLFFIGVSLYRAKQVLSGYQPFFRTSMEVNFSRFPRVILGALVILLVLGLTLFLARWALFHYNIVSQNFNLFLLFLLGIILIAEIIYCFYIIPLIVIDNYRIGSAIYQSANFLRYQIKPIVLNYFFLILLWAIIYPYSLHENWLKNHYLNIPFDMIVILIFLPLIANLIILTKQELQRISE